MNISSYLDNDMTLREVSNKLIEQSKGRKRNYLGMSEIGNDCWRMLWYRFRNVLEEHLSLQSILSIEDGYKQEDIMADRLRLIKDIKLDTVNPETGTQFEFKYLSGHFAGHCDGIIQGIFEAPKTIHIWENKAVNEKKFKQLKELILSEGEKNALKLWDEIYYAQAIIYMQAANLTRHYLTVQTPGGRDYTSCRTEHNTKEALSIIAKAETIIRADKPLPRLSENRSFYKCNWCGMKEVCFDNKVPDVNCRTCAFSEPVIDEKRNDAVWKCYKKNIEFTGNGILDCDQHLFLNTLVPFKTTGADESTAIPNWIKYSLPTGESFYNINSSAKTIPGMNCLTSKEIYEKEFFELCFNEDKIKSEEMKEIQKDKKEIKKLKGMI